METAQRTLFLSERMMTLANIMYNYIIASGARDVVDRYERQALDEALNIDLTNSYYDALIRHRIKTNIQFSEAFLAVQDREPAYMRTVDEEIGDLLCDQAARYGDWKLEELTGRFAKTYFGLAGRTLGHFDETRRKRLILSLFETRWAQYPYVVKRLSMDYPALDFTYYYVEERILAINGRMKFKNGRCQERLEAKANSNEAYDIACYFYTEKEIRKYYWYDGEQWHRRRS